MTQPPPELAPPQSPAGPPTRSVVLACVALLAGLGASTASAPLAARSEQHDRMLAALHPIEASASAARELRPQAASGHDSRPPAADQVISQGTLRRGSSLASALHAQGVDAAAVHQVARELSPLFDFRRAQPGDRYRLVQDRSGGVVDFRYSTGRQRAFHLYRDQGRFVARKEQTQLSRRLARLAGTVHSTVYEALRDLGAQVDLAGRFVDLFAWDIDFNRSVRAGDDFQILYERIYQVDSEGEATYLRPGRILAARYIGSAGDHSAVYFEDDGGFGSYYRPDGSALDRQFVAAPLRYDRISSRFSPARRHPILNVVRPHHGIDYAAPEGTPVWSVAAGTVSYRGRSGGFGNLVKVRHPNGYVSYYGHLSRFKKGLHVGQSIEQKQVVGYVGHTGLATGPHVCFRIARDGHYINPARIKSPAAKSVSDEFWGDFQLVRDRLLSELDGETLLVSEEAG